MGRWALPSVMLSPYQIRVGLASCTVYTNKAWHHSQSRIAVATYPGRPCLQGFIPQGFKEIEPLRDAVPGTTSLRYNLAQRQAWPQEHKPKESCEQSTNCDNGSPVADTHAVAELVHAQRLGCQKWLTGAAARLHKTEHQATSCTASA